MKTRRGAGLIKTMQAEDVDAEAGPKEGPSQMAQPLRSRRDYGCISCKKTADFAISKDDKAVLDAFIDGKAAESKKLSTDGKTLEGLWMGGKEIAIRDENGNIWAGKDRPQVKSDEVILRALKKLTPSRYYKGSVKTASTMSFEDYWAWLDNLKVGDDVMLCWTAGSGGHYSGRAKLVRVNPKSVAGKLEEVVDSQVGGEGYPIGHIIVLPKSILDRTFRAFFNAPTPIGVDRIAPAGRAAGMCGCGCGKQEDEWMNHDEVAKICSACGDKMKKAGIKRIRKSYFMKAIEDTSLRESIATIRDEGKKQVKAEAEKVENKFLSVAENIAMLKNKYNSESEEALFLGIVRDMAVHIGRGNFSRVRALAQEIESDFG